MCTGRAEVSEEELREKKTVPTNFGETLSWEYLCYVRENPTEWRIATKILYGSNDNLTSRLCPASLYGYGNAVKSESAEIA